MLVGALFLRAPKWKQPESPSVDEWAKKIWHIHTTEYYLTVKKEWCTVQATIQMTQIYTK